jgi:hypothetical protein
VLYEKPNPRFCGVIKRDVEAGFSLYIGRMELLRGLALPPSGVANGPGFGTSLPLRLEKREGVP